MTNSRRSYVTFSQHMTEEDAEDAAEKLAARVNGHDAATAYPLITPSIAQTEAQAA